MSRAVAGAVRALWDRVRAGDLRAAAQAARERAPRASTASTRAELHLVAAACAMRQGDHPEAIRELDAAAAAARGTHDLSLRVESWRAELACFQGRYSAATQILERITGPLESLGKSADLAFALRVHIAALLAQGNYAAIERLAGRALAAAQRGGDDYVRVQVLNVLGAAAFDRATSKLAHHARAHLPALGPEETAPMEEDARVALRLFEEASRVAKRAGYEFAAWYVAGNIERLEIVLGRPERAVRAIRKRLKILQQRGATYDEIVTRSNLGWALRNLGRHAEALHELDAALRLARRTGTFNVLLEYLHYDRSLVLEALHDLPAARASYRRYLQMVTARQRGGPGSALPKARAAPVPLEPWFLKRADRFIADRLGVPITLAMVASHCGVSGRTLEKAFSDFRGITPVAHVRNMRLDHAHRALGTAGTAVSAVAARFGFGSATTFAIEYRKRFGVAPRTTRDEARGRKVAPAEPLADRRGHKSIDDT